jgi:hypothetical protein
MSPSVLIHTRVWHHGLAIRLFAVFVGFWMWMLPQMLSARALATPDEFGSRPIPVNEEEETKHLNLFEVIDLGHESGDTRQGEHALWPSEDRPEVATHGEVPHPPPWLMA